MPPWLLFVILIVVILIILWILISGNPGSKPEETMVEAKLEPAAEPETPLVETVVEAIAPDDLKKIEGIGPKIAGLLTQHGILTFQQLSDTPTEQLQSILDDADIRIANPGSWPEQAKLASIGDWDSLSSLQDSLKGGKRE
ncbi:MAG: hypothetical protein HPY85_11015 [Anaerolineae bacterium]|nr:hypothetical protein [Anaerolineae bacterium]